MAAERGVGALEHRPGPVLRSEVHVAHTLAVSGGRTAAASGSRASASVCTWRACPRGAGNVLRAVRVGRHMRRCSAVEVRRRYTSRRLSPQRDSRMGAE